MEENKMSAMRELSLEEMGKVSGGVDNYVIYIEGLGISGDGRHEVKVSPQEGKIPDIVIGHRVDGSYFLEGKSSPIDELLGSIDNPPGRNGIGNSK